MFRSLADSWHWPPEVVEKLTPQQVIHLSEKAGGAEGGGITIGSQAELDHWRERWLVANSEEALLARGERMLARERARGKR